MLLEESKKTAVGKKKSITQAEALKIESLKISKVTTPNEPSSTKANPADVPSRSQAHKIMNSTLPIAPKKSLEDNQAMFASKPIDGESEPEAVDSLPGNLHVEASGSRRISGNATNKAVEQVAS